MTQRLRRGLAVLVILGILGGSVARLVYVHEHTWEWSLVPSATTPKLEFAHRSYLPAAEQPEAPPGWSVQGRTMGGGIILAPPTGPYVPTVIYVKSAGHLTGYGLSGGP
jgi:hypothetical protein